jgi:hypothetical protein
MMFACKLYMYLKNDGALAFKEKIEDEVIPLLRQQKGFLEQIAFLYLNGREVQSFSLWTTAEDAEAYNRETHPKVLRMLASVIDGAPRLETFDVLSSTLLLSHGCQSAAAIV